MKSKNKKPKKKVTKNETTSTTKKSRGRKKTGIRKTVRKPTSKPKHKSKSRKVEQYKNKAKRKIASSGYKRKSTKQSVLKFQVRNNKTGKISLKSEKQIRKTLKKNEVLIDSVQDSMKKIRATYKRSIKRLSPDFSILNNQDFVLIFSILEPVFFELLKQVKNPSEYFAIKIKYGNNKTKEYDYISTSLNSFDNLKVQGGDYELLQDKYLNPTLADLIELFFYNLNKYLQGFESNEVYLLTTIIEIYTDLPLEKKWDI